MVAALFWYLFLLIVFVDPDARVVGDQGLDFARSAQGFLFRNGLLFRRTGVTAIDAPAMIIVVAR
jgi:hypothetical protein